MRRMPWLLLPLIVGTVGPLSAQSQNQLAKNKALVSRFGEACNSKNFAVMREILAPDFVRHSQATPDVVVQNADQMIAYLRADSATVPDSHQTVKHIIAEGDLVAVWLTYEGTQEGQMGPFPPSHKKLHLDVSGVFRVQNGKLAELWVTWDNLAGLQQLGYFPPPRASQSQP